MLRARIKLNNHSSAVQHIDSLLARGNEQVKAELLMLKARAMEKLRNFNEVAINYEQAAKHGSAEVSALALFKLAKFRIRQKDFYEALFDIKRIQDTSANKKIKVFRSLIDGVMLCEGVDCVDNKAEGEDGTSSAEQNRAGNSGIEGGPAARLLLVQGLRLSGQAPLRSRLRLLRKSWETR